ncbi:hypothetical protein AVEN_243889-1 [Araneus ventricosus]|uniref:Uncharacterized protein n=1 Tax=Araneus ventricosus TaxID=182803 RepID=A0A4Y2N8A2_ARAVE|nr:hypothetical protein AVEN_243889-1 [Araneus ventricosus]
MTRLSDELTLKHVTYNWSREKQSLLKSYHRDFASKLKERVTLTPANEAAKSLRNFILLKQPAELIKYESVDSIGEVEVAAKYPVEFLYTLAPPGIPPQVLYLKV